jgi:hypothetical protein
MWSKAAAMQRDYRILERKVGREMALTVLGAANGVTRTRVLQLLRTPVGGDEQPTGERLITKNGVTRRMLRRKNPTLLRSLDYGIKGGIA